MQIKTIAQICLLSAIYAFSVAPATASFPLSSKSTIAPMIKEVAPAVVTISVTGNYHQRGNELYQYFFGPMPQFELQFRGLGSGVIFDEDEGYIITNNHVINNANDIIVQLNDGREYEAELIGQDPFTDIALLKLKEDIVGLNAVVFANSDKLEVGDFAVAIGNPFGVGQTVTSGIISALGRSGLQSENFENYIQTDAAINSGNSGGALVNLEGELIGINTAIVGPNGGNVGIGFAIPSNMVRSIVDQIIEYGEVKRGVLGIQGRELTAELAKSFGYNKTQGGFVNQVMPDSSAEEAGIQAGDIIVSLDGKAIKSFSALRAKIATKGPGKKVIIELIRNGEKKEVTAILNELSSQNKLKTQDYFSRLQGAELIDTNKGVEVISVEKNSNAEQYGLKTGDIIIGINQNQISKLSDLEKELKNTSGLLAVFIRRGVNTLYLVIN